jgi:hypothetical protein
VARAILAIGAVVWLAGASIAIGLARLALDRILALLPALAIDADAVGGALTAIGAALGGVGVAHVAVLVGLRRAEALAMTAGVLLGGVLSVVMIALAAAALASAARDASNAPILLATASAALLAAVGYGVVAVGFAREVRAKPHV